MANVRFSYWTDPLCIWAYVAQDKLDRILKEFGPQLDIEYRVVPVFGSVPHRFSKGSWSRSGIEGRVAATARVAAEHGRPEVDGTVWRTATPASSWSPGSALKAVFALEEDGLVEPGCGARYQWALRERFFRDNRNVALRSEQLAVAELCDIPRAPFEQHLDDGTALAALWEDHLERERLKVQGSPTYVFDGGRSMFYGNFDFDALHATVQAYVRGLAPGGSEC